MGQTLGLELRSEAIADGTPAAPGGRFAAEFGVHILSILAFSALAAYFITLSPAFTFGIGALGLATVPLATWGLHRAMGGKGLVGVGYLGWLIGAAVTGLFAVQAFMQPSSPFPAFAGGVLSVALSVPIALEISDGAVRRSRD